MQILHYWSCSIFNGIVLKEITIYNMYKTDNKNSNNYTNSDYYALIMDLHG